MNNDQQVAGGGARGAYTDNKKAREQIPSAKEGDCARRGGREGSTSVKQGWGY